MTLSTIASTEPPPFTDYIPVDSQDIWEKLCRGKIQAHVYSATAPGDFEPVPIPAAAFVIADKARTTPDDYGSPQELAPFQILWIDSDSRRRGRRATRMPVPHWVYVKTAEPEASAAAEPSKPACSQGNPLTPKQRTITAAIAACFPEGVPSEDTLPRGRLYAAIQKWIKAERPNISVSDKAIGRVAYPK
jgi:hypothetical protein